MRIVIPGASRFGEAIAATLIEADHEVVITDRNRDRPDDLSSKFRGDG